MNQSQSRPRSHSQSHLISLATLLRSAEARYSAVPPPPAAAVAQDDSGVIDLIAMEKRAREERASAATRTPVPVVSAVHHDHAPGRSPIASDGDLVAAMDAARLRKKRVLLGGVAGGVLLLVTLIGFAVSGGSAPPPPVAAVAPVVTPVVATPAPAPPAPVVQAALPVAPVAAAEPEPAAASSHKKKKHKASHGAKTGKQSLMKVLSGGT